MPTWKCPGCGGLLTEPDSPAASRLRCGACGEVFPTQPEAPQGDEPGPPEEGRSRAASLPKWAIAIAAGCACAVVGVVLYVFVFSGGDLVVPEEPALDVTPPEEAPGPAEGAAGPAAPAVAAAPGGGGTVPPATKPATSKPVTPKPPGIETDLAEAAARPTFPAGIILALSFEADQWTKEADGTIVVKDTSGRAGDAPLTARTSRGTLGAGGKTGTGIAFPPGSRADLGIPAKATAGLKTFTFAFWVKTTESGKGKMYWTHPTLLGYRSNGHGSRDFGITSSRGHIGYWSGLDRKGDRDYQSAKIRINDGAWHHIALTNDGKALRLYVDARAVSPKPLPAGLALPTAQIPLGGSRSDPRDRYGPLSHSGTYDELQLYNRALTPTEIAAIAGLDRPSTREKRGPGKTKRRKRAKKKAQEKALRTPSGANTHTSPPSLISLVRKKRPGGSPRRARRARSLPGQKLLQENPPPPRPPRSLR